MNNMAAKLSRAGRRLVHNSYRLLASILVAVIVGSIIIVAYGEDPVLVYRLLFRGSFGSHRSLFITIQRATPLIFTALASTFAFKTGVFNTGVESQFYIGALAGTVMGYVIALPPILHLPLVLLVGFVVGALWALVPALLRQRFGISEIVTTIMTNYVAFQLRDFLLVYVLRAGPHLAETPFVNDSVVIPQFNELIPGLGRGSQAHVGIFVALGMALFLAFILKYTVKGYEWRMVGQSPPYSSFIGIDLRKVSISGFIISGGVAGFGGVIEVLGVWRRYKQAFGTGLGFKGNLAALLGGRTVAGSTLAAIFYGSMEAGSVALEWDSGVPRQLIDVLVSLIIFFMAAPGLWDVVKERLFASRKTRSSLGTGKEA